MFGCLLPRVPFECQKEEETYNKELQEEGPLHFWLLQFTNLAREVLLRAEKKQRFPAEVIDGHVQIDP